MAEVAADDEDGCGVGEVWCEKSAKLRFGTGGCGANHDRDQRWKEGRVFKVSAMLVSLDRDTV